MLIYKLLLSILLVIQNKADLCNVTNPQNTNDCTQYSDNLNACCLVGITNSNKNSNKCVSIPLNMTFLTSFMSRMNMLDNEAVYLSFNCGEVSSTAQAYNSCGIMDPKSFQDCNIYSSNTTSCCYLKTTNNKTLCLLNPTKISQNLTLYGNSLFCSGSTYYIRYFIYSIIILNIFL